MADEIIRVQLFGATCCERRGAYGQGCPTGLARCRTYAVDPAVRQLSTPLPHLGTCDYHGVRVWAIDHTLSRSEPPHPEPPRTSSGDRPLLDLLKNARRARRPRACDFVDKPDSGAVFAGDAIVNASSVWAECVFGVATEALRCELHLDLRLPRRLGLATEEDPLDLSNGDVSAFDVSVALSSSARPR